MLNPKLCLIAVLRGDVDFAFSMNLIHFLEQRGVGALRTSSALKAALPQQTFDSEDRNLREVAFFVDESQHVHRFAGENVQGALVVLVVDVLPNDVFASVLLLLQLENVPDEELLQLLVGKVDAQLLKAAQIKRVQLRVLE